MSEILGIPLAAPCHLVTAADFAGDTDRFSCPDQKRNLIDDILRVAITEGEVTQFDSLPEGEKRLRIRVVRHRGFNLCALNMEQDCQQLRITVTVESVRPIQQLWSQLVKLVDVSRVDALEQQPRIRA